MTEQAPGAIGTIGAIRFEAAPAGAAASSVDLAIHCLFAHEASAAAFESELRRVDAALGGAVGRLWHDGIFGGGRGETLMLTKPPPQLGMENLLLLGLGQRQDWAPHDMRATSADAIGQALKLRAPTVSFAPGIGRYDLAGDSRSRMLEHIGFGAAAAVRRIDPATASLRCWTCIIAADRVEADRASLAAGFDAGCAAS